MNPAESLWIAEWLIIALFCVLPVLVIALYLQIARVVRSIRAERHLRMILRQEMSESDWSLLDSMSAREAWDEPKLQRFRRLVEQAAGHLDRFESAEVVAPLYQDSLIGRRRYLQILLDRFQADQRRHTRNG